jgi:Leucine-rich repeat (LRR) protein
MFVLRGAGNCKLLRGNTGRSIPDLSRNQLESIEPFIRLAPQISELILDSNKISSVGMSRTYLSLHIRLLSAVLGI